MTDRQKAFIIVIDLMSRFPISYCVMACLAIGGAAATLGEIPDTPPGSDQHCELLISLKSAALQFLKKHHYPDAVKSASAAATLAPDDYDALALLALARIRNSEYLDAKAVLERLPASERRRYGLERAVQALDLLEEADRLIERGYSSGTPKLFADATHLIAQAAALDKIDVVNYNTLGWLYLDKVDDPERAYHSLHRYLRSYPSDIDAKKLLALASSRTNRDREALAIFLEIVADYPNDLWMIANLAKLYVRLRDYKRAKRLYRDILVSAPDNLDGRLGLLQLASLSGEGTRALSETSTLAEDNPTNADLKALLGSIYLQTQHLPEAKKNFDEALAITPHQYEAEAGEIVVRDLQSWVITPAIYHFGDSTQFIKDMQEITVRSPLWHRTKVTLGFGRWTFHHLPNSLPVYPIDPVNNAEINRSNGWRTRDDRLLQVHHFVSSDLDFTITLLRYNYDAHHDSTSAGVSLRWEPTHGTSFYLSAVTSEPIIDNLNTAKTGFSRDSLGIGVDRALTDLISIQLGATYARYTDGNVATSGTFQISRPVVRRISGSLRLGTDILAFDRTALGYFSPTRFPVYRVTYDANPTLTKHLSIAMKASLPLVSTNQIKPGIETEVGGRFHATDHLDVKASYFTHKIPTAIQWSGRGAKVQADFRW